MTGGSGFVGRHLLLRLLAQGHEVLALVRSEASAAVVASVGATPVLADLCDVGAVAGRLEGCDVVVHAAADTRSWGRPGDLELVNVAGTRALLDAARTARVPRLVHVSTAAVLADGHPLRFVDESAPYPRRYAGEYSRTKALAEQLVVAADGRELRTVVVRPRLAWGPGDTTVMPQVLRAVEEGRWAWVNGGEYLTSTCHVLNLCLGIERAAEQGRGGQVYFVTDGAPVPFREFVTRWAAAYGVRLPTRSVPSPVLRTATGVLDRGWRVLHLRGEPPVAGVALALGVHEVTVNDARARADLGYVPVVSVDQGLTDLAAHQAG